jgi:nicotinamidase-related amidase
MTTALILIDIQNDYFPGGKGELRGPIEASLQARRLLDCFRQAGWPIVHIQHIAIKPGAATFLPNTPGSEIHANVRPLEGETVFQKHYPNSFRDTPLLEHLRGLGVTRLIICGMMTHMCVHAAHRAAFDYGFEVITAADACATRDLVFAGQTVPAAQVHAAFLAGVTGTYGKALPVDEVLKLIS